MYVCYLLYCVNISLHPSLMIQISTFECKTEILLITTGRYTTHCSFKIIDHSGYVFARSRRAGILYFVHMYQIICTCSFRRWFLKFHSLEQEFLIFSTTTKRGPFVDDLWCMYIIPAKFGSNWSIFFRIYQDTMITIDNGWSDTKRCQWLTCPEAKRVWKMWIHLW